MDDSTKEKLFDKFEVIKVLKKDQHAAVYLAHHIYLGKKIILKVLNTDTISDKVVIERFKREAKILAQLDSVNIIKVLDFGMFKEYFYISFEYFPSQNLRQIIKENKLNNEQKGKLVIQLFKGLEVAHKHNIIHRDIKPENILVNNSLELKIGDFGLAQVINESFVTSQYSLVGTPCYMSPEQISGKQLSIQSDLFSVGIVILELYTNKNPFLGNDVNESINLITKFDEKKILLELDGVPENIQTLIRKLIKRNPRERYNNCDEVLEGLGASISGKSGILNIEKGKSKRNKSIVLLLIFAGIVILLIFLLLPSDNSKTQDIQTPKAGTKISEKIDSTKNNSNQKTEKEIIPINISKTQKDLSKSNSEIKANSSVTYKKQNGGLFVECLPWAEIYINNKKYETTPMKNNIQLLEGKYELKLLHPEYPPFIDTIKILPKEITNFKVNLDTLFGFLDCKVFPWGNIYVDDIYKGETPLLNPIILSPKKHTIKIENPGFKSIEKTITITKGDTFKLVEKFNSNLN